MRFRAEERSGPRKELRPPATIDVDKPGRCGGMLVEPRTARLPRFAVLGCVAESDQAQKRFAPKRDLDTDGTRGNSSALQGIRSQNAQDEFLLLGGGMGVESRRSSTRCSAAAVEQVSDRLCGHRLRDRVFHLLDWSARLTHTAIP